MYHNNIILDIKLSSRQVVKSNQNQSQSHTYIHTYIHTHTYNISTRVDYLDPIMLSPEHEEQLKKLKEVSLYLILLPYLDLYWYVLTQNSCKLCMKNMLLRRINKINKEPILDQIVEVLLLRILWSFRACILQVVSMFYKSWYVFNSHSILRMR